MPKLSDFDGFFQSKKNANCILDLIKSLLSDDEGCLLSSIDVFKDVFTKIFKEGMLRESSNHDTAEEKFKQWLRGCYNECVSHLFDHLVYENCAIQEKSLDTLMTLVLLEGETSIKEGWFFPNDLFQKVVHALISKDLNQQSLVATFQKYTCYDDIKTYLLKAILKVFQDAFDKDGDTADASLKLVNDVFLENAFCLLNTLKYPKDFNAESNTFIPREGFILKEKLFRRLFSSAWTQFLRASILPPSLLRRVLLVLHKRVLPHMYNPCSMTDFLTDAYKEGGVLSLLSLNGLFYLIDKHNVEYPDFFTKLYSLFDDKIVNGKFSARFFFLSDLFLSSTHLPAYLVAAFLKRISRVSLSSRTEVILRILPFVCNILIRNPTLNTLVHRPEPLDLSADPYNFETPDPAQSRALESSLWEIKTLQNHVHPEVSRKAKLINKVMPIIEFDLSRVLDTSIEDIYKKDRKRKWSDAPTSVQKPQKILDWCILTNKCLS